MTSQQPLKERTASSMFWSALNNGTIQLLNLLFGIFLARLLSPADYGIVGVLTIFTLIAGNLQSSGFTQALINLKKPTGADYNSVFWFNVTASVIIYAVLWFCAPLIADYFKQPVLVSVSRYTFLAIVISSLGIAHAAYMAKNMMNREIAISNAVALLASGTTGIVMAWQGYAYWSLATQQIVYIAVLNVGRYYFTPWHPTLRIDFGPVARMFGFSVKILFTNIINTLTANVLTVILGRLFAIGQVGNYTQANKWQTMTGTMVSGTLTQVVQTVLVSVNDERERELRVFRKMVRFTALLAFPILLGLALVSKEFILVALGEKWLESARLLAILCVGGAFMPFYTLYQHLVISSGKSGLYLTVSVVQIVAQVAVVLSFAPMGFEAMIVAFSAFTVLWLLVWHMVTWRLINYRLTSFLADVAPFLLIAVATMAITYFITLPITNLIALLAMRVILAAIIYAAILKLLRVKIFDECVQFVKNKFRKNPPENTESISGAS